MPFDLRSRRRLPSAGGALRGQLNSGRITVIPEAGHYCAPVPGRAEEHARSIIEYAMILWRRKGILIATILMCTGGVYGVLKLLRPVYRATTSVMFERSPEIVPLGTGSPTDDAAVEASFQTQVELFQSRSLIRRVLGKLNSGEWAERPVGEQSLREREFEFVANSVKVIPAKGTRLIKIQAEAHDSQLAAAFANTIVSEYIALEHENEWNRDRSDREWLERQVADLRQSIESSEKKLFTYASASNLDLTPNNEKGPDSRTVRLQDELSKAQVERFSAEARYEMATKTSPSSESEVFESPTERDDQGKLIELRRQLAEANSLWTSNHPKVKQLEAQVNVFTMAVKKEREEVLSRINSDYISALRKEQLLSAEYLSAVKAVTNRENMAVHYNLLKRDLDRDRELYDAIVQREKQLGIASGLRPTPIHLVDLAEPASRPTRPNIALTSYLALICSTFLGVMIVLAYEHFGSTVQLPGESPAYLNIRELGAIPSQRAIKPRFQGWLTSILNLGIGKRAVANGSVGLATRLQTGSITAQCFRGALASILFVSDNLRTIVVTSAEEGDGKTTIVTNLALVLARMGRKVLLVDADHRKPRLHKIFGIPDAIGLRELIEGRETILLDKYVRETHIDGLHLLQSGHSVETSDSRAEFPEILLSHQLVHLMRIAKRDYDFVLIDTPPVLPLPDARIWGRLADGVVLVIRAGETDRQRALAAVSTLSKDGVVLLATILNDWYPRGRRLYEYYYPAPARRA
jgi:succinoglycan biosynthesis transport protein ExoP